MLASCMTTCRACRLALPRDGATQVVHERCALAINGDRAMTESNPSKPINRRRASERRRLTLLASGAALGIAVILGGPLAYRELNSANAAPVHLPPGVAEPAGFADLVASVKPAVISVRVEIDKVVDTASLDEGAGGQAVPPGWRFGHFGSSEPQHQILAGEGSGFFISADGYAVTNNHVVADAREVQVMTDDGSTYPAKVIGTDPQTDLALIKVDGKDFPYVEFAETEPRIGDWVVAIGNPFGLGGTVTAGIVSAEGREIGLAPFDKYIQIDAPINKGNSGGPAFDLQGKVIGINSAIFSPSGGSVGIGFDIPATTAKAVIAQLKGDGHVTRGWIGVQIQPVTSDIADSLGMKKAGGAMVDEALPDGPAAKAGLKPGDVITAVNGEAIKDSRELARTIGAMDPGTSVTLGVLKDGKPKTLTLTLGTMPYEQHQAQADGQGEASPDEAPSSYGLALAPASSVAGAGEKGVVVVGIDLNGVAAREGVEVGDVILQVGGKAVAIPRDVSKDLSAFRKQGKHSVLIQLKSGDAMRFVGLPLDHPPA